MELWQSLLLVVVGFCFLSGIWLALFATMHLGGVSNVSASSCKNSGGRKES